MATGVVQRNPREQELMGRCAIINDTCPQTADPAAKRYCPAWWESIWISSEGKAETRSSCAWRQLPDYLSEAVKASHGAAVSAQQARDGAGELNAGLRAVSLAIHTKRLAIGAE